MKEKYILGEEEGVLIKALARTGQHMYGPKQEAIGCITVS